ncbi:MAG: DUF4118 domain-containing protein [Loktanella sp.]|nr:DUF4118 domain-containing protein [Loktanella sp.]
MSDQTELMDKSLTKGAAVETHEPPVTTALIETMSRLLLEERQMPAQIMIAGISVALATWLRFVVDDVLPAGFPFVTFFPAVLVTALFASVRAATGVALVTGIIALVFFIPPFGGVELSGPVLIAMIFYFAITATEIFFISLSSHALQRIKAERDRSAWLAESRDLMFSELQHRVSNNLANVAALLRLQASATESSEARSALTTSMARVQTVARVQRSLYHADEQQVEVRAFLTQLANDTTSTMASDTEVSVNVVSDRFKIHRDHAVPFGLIASELMMNAIEHASPDGSRLLVEVRCERSLAQQDEPATVRLTVADNGQGIAEPNNPAVATSLGMSISTGFAQSLGGALTLANRKDGPGAVATLAFPDRSAEETA